MYIQKYKYKLPIKIMKNVLQNNFEHTYCKNPNNSINKIYLIIVVVNS